MTFSFLIVEYSGKSSQAEKKKRRAQKMEEDAESSSASDDEELEAEIVEKANDAIQSMAIDNQVDPPRVLIIRGPGTHNWRHS